MEKGDKVQSLEELSYMGVKNFNMLKPMRKQMIKVTCEQIIIENFPELMEIPNKIWT